MGIIDEINQRCGAFMRSTGGLVPNVLMFNNEGFDAFALDMRSVRAVMFDSPGIVVTHWRGMLVITSPAFPERFDVAYRVGVFK